MADERFDLKDLVDTISELREKISDKAFWSRPKANRDGAKNSLMFVYLNTEMTTEEFERVTPFVLGAMQEYGVREVFATIPKQSIKNG